MKSFSAFIGDLNEGSTNSALTGHLAELLLAVKTHGRAGQLKLSIKVIPAVRGGGDVDKITVTVDSQLALPKPQQPSDFFFLTDDAQPTRQHPRQGELPLRDVTGANAGGADFKDFSTPDADGVINPKKANEQ